MVECSVRDGGPRSAATCCAARIIRVDQRATPKKDAARLLQVGGRVHSGFRRLIGDRHADSVAMPKRTQLFERFELLDRRGCERRNSLEEAAAICVQTRGGDMRAARPARASGPTRTRRAHTGSVHARSTARNRPCRPLLLPRWDRTFRLHHGSDDRRWRSPPRHVRRVAAQRHESAPALCAARRPGH